MSDTSITVIYDIMSLTVPLTVNAYFSREITKIDMQNSWIIILIKKWQLNCLTYIVTRSDHNILEYIN